MAGTGLNEADSVIGHQYALDHHRQATDVLDGLDGIKAQVGLGFTAVTKAAPQLRVKVAIAHIDASGATHGDIAIRGTRANAVGGQDDGGIVASTCSRKRSASRAAMQPEAAEVMAWRYT